MTGMTEKMMRLQGASTTQTRRNTRKTTETPQKMQQQHLEGSRQNLRKRRQMAKRRKRSARRWRRKARPKKKSQARLQETKVAANFVMTRTAGVLESASLAARGKRLPWPACRDHLHGAQRRSATARAAARVATAKVRVVALIAQSAGISSRVPWSSTKRPLTDL